MTQFFFRYVDVNYESLSDYSRSELIDVIEDADCRIFATADAAKATALADWQSYLREINEDEHLPVPETLEWEERPTDPRYRDGWPSEWVWREGDHHSIYIQVVQLVE